MSASAPPFSANGCRRRRAGPVPPFPYARASGTIRRVPKPIRPTIQRRSDGAKATQPSVARPGPRQRCRKIADPRPRSALGQFQSVRQDEVIEPVAPEQPLGGKPVRRADHEVVILVPGIVGPEIAGSDRHRPVAGPRHPVGAIEASDDPVSPGRCGPVAFALVGRDTAAPDGAGKDMPAEPEPHRGQDHVRRVTGSGPISSFFTSR
jgi:hypothetical protein